MSCYEVLHRLLLYHRLFNYLDVLKISTYHSTPFHPTRTLKAISLGDHHTELGEDFCLLFLPRLTSSGTISDLLST